MAAALQPLQAAPHAVYRTVTCADCGHPHPDDYLACPECGRFNP